jgi:hypothetical protein
MHPARVKIGPKRCHGGATATKTVRSRRGCGTNAGPVVCIEMKDRSRRARSMSAPGRELPDHRRSRFDPFQTDRFPDSRRLTFEMRGRHRLPVAVRSMEELRVTVRDLSRSLRETLRWQIVYRYLRSTQSDRLRRCQESDLAKRKDAWE